jgi:hypothetical protein
MAANTLNDLFVEQNPYATYIKNLEVLLQSPAPQAKNPDLQTEITKADALFRKVIQDGIDVAKERAIVDKETVQFISSIRPESITAEKKQELTQALELFKTRSNTLKTRSAEAEQNYGRIYTFIHLLETNQNPSADEKAAFWSWANEKFWASSIVEQPALV